MSEVAKQGTTQDQTCQPCLHGNHDWCRKPVKVGGEGQTHWVAICCCGGQPSKLKKVAPTVGLPKTPPSKVLDEMVEIAKRKKQLEAFQADREARWTGIPIDPVKRAAILKWARMKAGGDSDGQRQ